MDETDDTAELRRGPDRRVGPRREDPNVWDPAHKQQVDTLWGMVVGGGLIMASVTLLFWAIVNDRVELPILGACLFVLCMGLIAGKPKVFMPVFSSILRKIPWGKVAREGRSHRGHEHDDGDMTRAIRALDSDTDEEM